jgi:CRP/FNR family transcriptional regulator, cyclic AMP receptor protein
MIDCQSVILGILSKETEMDDWESISKELKKIPWFRELSQEHVQKIAEITNLRQVKAGEVLFREGDKEQCVYIVIEGRVALDMFVPHRGKVRFYTAEPWEVFGWSSVTPTIHQRTAGATAVVDGLIVCINAEKLREICDADHDLGYLVMRRLANVVAGRLLVTRLQLLDMFANPETKNA